MTAPAEDPRGGEVCGRSFRSGSGRYYDCGRATGHEGGHAISDPAPPPVRDAIDAEASRLWAEQHDDHSGPFWQASCPACTAIPAEAFRLGYRAARPAGDRAQPTQELREAIAETLHYAAQDPEDFYQVAWEDNHARSDLYDAADALLAGPLAALLAAPAVAEKRIELARIEGRAESLNAEVHEMEDDDDAQLLAVRAIQWEQEAEPLRRALDGTA